MNSLMVLKAHKINLQQTVQTFTGQSLVANLTSEIHIKLLQA